MEPSAAPLPTRVSTIKGDPGYLPDVSRLLVRFNGVLLRPKAGEAERRLAVTADAETGELVYLRAVRQPSGNYRTDTSEDRTELRYYRDVGRVEILRREDAAD